MVCDYTNDAAKDSFWFFGSQFDFSTRADFRTVFAGVIQPCAASLFLQPELNSLAKNRRTRRCCQPRFAGWQSHAWHPFERVGLFETFMVVVAQWHKLNRSAIAARAPIPSERASRSIPVGAWRRMLPSSAVGLSMTHIGHLAVSPFRAGGFSGRLCAPTPKSLRCASIRCRGDAGIAEPGAGDGQRDRRPVVALWSCS